MCRRQVMETGAESRKVALRTIDEPECGGGGGSPAPRVERLRRRQPPLLLVRRETALMVRIRHRPVSLSPSAGGPAGGPAVRVPLCRVTIPAESVPRSSATPPRSSRAADGAAEAAYVEGEAHE